MPSTSKKQARLMAACANDPKIAASKGIPQDVAKEFMQADLKAGYLKPPPRGRKRKR